MKIIKASLLITLSLLASCTGGFDELRPFGEDDTKSPNVTSPTLNFSNINDNSVRISWNEATDNKTAAEDLEYKLVYRNDSPITCLTNASNSLEAMPWTPNKTNIDLTELTTNSSYYFNVIVKDKNDNMSLYTSNNINMSDSTPPTVINDTINFENTDAFSTKICWNVADDENTSMENLKYKLVHNTATISSIQSAENLTPDMDWSANITSQELSGLTFNQTYYFNVLVKDSNNNISIYNCGSVYTDDNTPPTLPSNKDITINSVDITKMNISFDESSDNYNNSTDLEYKIVYTTLCEITTSEKANAAILAQDWSSYSSSSPFTITNLDQNTSYFINILVRDTKGNISFYNSKQQKTNEDPGANQVPPVIPEPKEILITNNNDLTVDLTWEKATDDLIAQNELEYRIVRSLSSITQPDSSIANDYDFYNASLINDTDGDGWSTYEESGFTLDGTNITYSGIEVSGCGTTTFFAVGVRDSAHNTAYYTVAFKQIDELKGSLLAYWKLDNNYEDSVNHSSNYDGYLSGSENWVTGFDGTTNGAINLNGSSYISLNDSTYDSYFISNRITVCAWIKVSSSWGGNSYQNIVSKGNNMWRLQRNGSNNTIQFGVNVGDGGTLYYINSSIPVNDETWHHVLGTYNGDTGEMTIYIDGVKDTGGSSSYGSGSIPSMEWRIRIGNSSQNNDYPYNDYTDRWWNGAIDEVRIYKEVLTENEIRALAQ